LLERVIDGGTKKSRRHGDRAFSCRGLAPIGAGLCCENSLLISLFSAIGPHSPSRFFAICVKFSSIA
jgi:hypothetical protein